MSRLTMFEDVSPQCLVFDIASDADVSQQCQVSDIASVASESDQLDDVCVSWFHLEEEESLENERLAEEKRLKMEMKSTMLNKGSRFPAQQCQVFDIASVASESDQLDDVCVSWFHLSEEESLENERLAEEKRLKMEMNRLAEAAKRLVRERVAQMKQTTKASLEEEERLKKERLAEAAKRLVRERVAQMNQATKARLEEEELLKKERLAEAAKRLVREKFVEMKQATKARLEEEERLQKEGLAFLRNVSRRRRNVMQRG